MWRRTEEKVTVDEKRWDIGACGQKINIGEGLNTEKDEAREVKAKEGIRKGNKDEKRKRRKAVRDMRRISGGRKGRVARQGQRET